MADESKTRVTRRDLLLTVGPAAAALLVGRGAPAQTSMPHLEESDPTAKSLGYVNDAAQAKGDPLYKAGSMCSNCAQLQGKAGDQWRPCTIFAGKLVNANGWCKVWVAKPK